MVGFELAVLALGVYLVWSIERLARAADRIRKSLDSERWERAERRRLGLAGRRQED